MLSPLTETGLAIPIEVTCPDAFGANIKTATKNIKNLKLKIKNFSDTIYNILTIF
jgi:hypothetical protein